MGRIIVINIFVNYIFIMPLLIVSIYNRWAFAKFFPIFAIVLACVNIIFWLAYLIYKTFYDSEISVAKKSGFVLEMPTDYDEIAKLLSEEYITSNDKEINGIKDGVFYEKTSSDEVHGDESANTNKDENIDEEAFHEGTGESYNTSDINKNENLTEESAQRIENSYENLDSNSQEEEFQNLEFERVESN